MPSNPLTWGCIIVTIIALVAVLWPRKPKRPRPQQPPSDRERFNRMKGDWEGKQ